MKDLTSNSGVNTPAPQDCAPAPLQTTLRPLREQGPDALAPLPADPAVRASLSRLVLGFDNAANTIVTLFAPPASDEPIPKGARQLCATLTFLTPGSAEPHDVELHPPHPPHFQSAADAALFSPWLANHHFLAVQAAVHLLFGLLALAAALPAATDDEMDDPDDDPSHHPGLELAAA